jgi:hypothetical protein
MKVHLKWAAVLLLVITQSLHAENKSFPKDRFRQGFRPGLQGTYDKNPRKLVDDMFAGKDIFQVPNFAQSFLMNAQYCVQDTTVTIAELKAGITIGGAPDGFIQHPINSTYEISGWLPGYSKILWLARFPNVGESFLWFRGVCIMSCYCGNLMRPRFIPEDIAIVEEEPEEPYVPTQQVKATYVSNPAPVVNVYNTITSTNTNNNTSPIGASNLEFGDGGGGNRRQSYNDEPREMIVRTPARAVDWVSAAGNLLQGVGMMKQAFWPATQNVRVWGQQSNQRQWGNNYYNGGGGYNTGGGGYNNNGPWSGGTTLQSHGPLPNNLYNNGTGVIRGSHPYSNNASTGRSTGFTSNSGGGYYGIYNQSGGY